MGAGFLNWGQAFCDLLDHPAIMPVLRLRLGDAFRLDRLYGMIMRRGMAYGSLHADYGATATNENVAPGEYYAFRRGQIYEGFIVVAWALTDSGGEHGGFCCVPGSHKSHYKLPPQISQNHHESPHVVTPPMPAGSVILFSEALTHGTARWNARARTAHGALQVLRLAPDLDFQAGGRTDRLPADAAPARFSCASRAIPSATSPRSLRKLCRGYLSGRPHCL